MARRGKKKADCQAYQSAKTREKNKKRKLNKHLRKHGNDTHAAGALKKLNV